MKKFLVSVVALLLFSVVYSFAQTNLDVIYLKNGKTLKGRIVTDLPPDYLEIQLNNGEIKKVFYKDMKKMDYEVQPDKNTTSTENINIKEDSYPKIGSFGLGIGIPYGIVGANAELMFNDIVAVTAGFGYAIYTYGACAGGRIYFTPRESNFRPMVNVYYGTNVLALNNSYQMKSAGFNAGAGFKWMFGKKKRSGVEIEFIYILTSRLLNQRYEHDNIKTLKVCLGYRIGF
ncbi:MAG: hypothetical protein WCR42_10325 [bacterium]